MDKEIWKDIPNYEGLYQVSSKGRIKSLKSNKILSKRYSKKGYLQVILYKNGLSKSFKNHRLVAEAFIPNLENKPQVNHINGIKDDNRVENLEWNTCKENIKHSHKNKLKINPSYEKHPSSKAVCQYDLNGNFIKKYASISRARDELNIGSSHIVACCKGKQQTSYGYIWKYATKGEM